MRQQRSGAHASHRIITCLSNSCRHAARCCPPQFTCLCEGHCATAVAPSFSTTALAMASAVFSAACPKDAARLRCVTGDVLDVHTEDAVWLPSKAFRVGEYMQKQFRKKKTSCKPQSRSSGHWRHSPRMNTLVRGRTCQTAPCHVCLSNPRIPWHAYSVTLSA